MFYIYCGKLFLLVKNYRLLFCRDLTEHIRPDGRIDQLQPLTAVFKDAECAGFVTRSMPSQVSGAELVPWRISVPRQVKKSE